MTTAELSSQEAKLSLPLALGEQQIWKSTLTLRVLGHPQQNILITKEPEAQLGSRGETEVTMG